MARPLSTMQRSIAIEVRRTHLHLAILEHDLVSNVRRVHARSIPWLVDAPSLTTEQGLREVTAAFIRLAAEENLSGARVNLTLSGEYCVTRVIVGSSDVVRREIRHVEDRVPLYMGLGRGRKWIATDIGQLDARNQHATITVTNQDAPQVLMAAAENARLQIEHVEPSLIAVSRALGHGRLDADGPVIVVNVGERSSEIGISAGGRLLLDYRPAGRIKSDDVASVIARHQQRLQKFVDRYHRLTAGRLAQVYLTGRPEPIATAIRGFENHPELQATVLTPEQFGIAWSAESSGGGTRTRGRLHDGASGETTAGEVCAALGTCLFALQPPLERRGANLMEPIRATRRQPLGKLTRQTFWPAAAVLVLALGALGGAFWRYAQTVSVTNELATLAPERDRVSRLQAWVATADVTKRHLMEIRGKISERSRVELLTTIAQCMPPRVWLERIEVDAFGKVSLHGLGVGDDDIYDFVRWLSAAPGLKEVQLESTNGGQQTGAGALKFDVKFDLANPNDSVNPPRPSEITDASVYSRLPERSVASHDRYNPNFVPIPDRVVEGSR